MPDAAPEFAADLGDGLRLLPPLPRHAEVLFAAVDRSRERIGKWLLWVAGTTTPEPTRVFLRERCVALGRRRGFGTIVEDRGEVAGGVGMNWVDPQQRKGEIGYWLADGHEGHGMMTRAAAAILRHGHDHLRLRRIQILASVENVRSRAVAERLGLDLEATVRDGDVLGDGRVTDQVVYASIAEESRDSPPIEFVLPTSRPGVTLALQQPHHAGEIFALVDRERERLTRWLGNYPRRCQSPRDQRRLIREGWQTVADESALRTNIRVDGRIVGGLGVGGMSGERQRGSLGFWVAREHEGTGVVSAALRALVEHLWRTRPKLGRLELNTRRDNAASHRLAEACGFRHEGVLRSEARVAGEFLDLHLYGMTREDASG